jgi:hypothetical protein
MAYRPRAGRMCRRGPDNIARRMRQPAAEAPARFDTGKLATGMTAAFTHGGNSRNAAQPLAWRSPALRYRRERVAFCWTAQSPIPYSQKIQTIAKPGVIRRQGSLRGWARSWVVGRSWNPTTWDAAGSDSILREPSIVP